MFTKSKPVRKPSILKSYVKAVFLSFSTKAMHLELVSDLTTASFVVTFRQFMAGRGKPLIIWSDHGTNFVGATQELGELRTFLK